LPSGRVGRRSGLNGSSSTGSAGGYGPARHGGTCLPATAPGKLYGLFRRWQRNGVWARILAGLQTRADAAGLIGWDVGVDSTIMRAHQHAAGARRRGDLQREPPGGAATEPGDHSLGRSRGGLSTKVHLACEQGHKPLSLVVTAGQRGDAPQFQAVMAGVRVARQGRGRPRTRPDRVRADKAYSLRSKCLERVALDARDDGVWLKAYCRCCGSGGMAAPLSGTPRLLIEI
jgi:hypothetical protein